MKYVVTFGMSAFLVFLAVVQSSSTSGPPTTIRNRDNVRRLYGNPVSEVYRTSQDLTVRASFAPNGSLCQVHINSAGDAGITDMQLNALLDELVPKDVRGKYKIGTFLDVTCLRSVKRGNSTSNSQGKPATELVVDPCAECSGVSEDYEHVNITKYGNSNEYTSVHIAFHQPECKELDAVHH